MEKRLRVIFQEKDTIYKSILWFSFEEEKPKMFLERSIKRFMENLIFSGFPNDEPHDPNMEPNDLNNPNLPSFEVTLRSHPSESPWTYHT